MSLVIDASISIQCLDRPGLGVRTSAVQRQVSDAERANRLLEACGTDTWWVPGLWHPDGLNALLVAERRQLIFEARSDLFPMTASSSQEPQLFPLLGAATLRR